MAEPLNSNASMLQIILPKLALANADAHARVELNQQRIMLAFQPVPPHPCA